MLYLTHDGDLEDIHVSLFYVTVECDLFAVWVITHAYGSRGAAGFAAVCRFLHTISEMEWVSEQFLNGTSAQCRLFSALKR